MNVPHSVRSTISLSPPLMLVLPGYTGAGCSVPSAVLTTMLPSLSDVRNLSDTISYHLVLLKLHQGLILSVYFSTTKI